jgi:translocation and assembly module TamB
VVDGTVQASELTAGGQTFRSVRLASEGTPEASRFTASAQAQGFDLDAAGRLVPGDVNRLELATFQARRGGRRIALAQPAALAFRGGEVTIESLVVAVEGGRLSAQGRAGERLDLSLDIRALPLSAAEIFVPGLGLSGTLQGTATVTGTPADPAGRYDLSLSRIVAPQTRQAGVPPIDVTARGTLGDGRATVDGVVNAGRVGTLNVSGSVPLDAAGALDLAVRGRIDASAANTVLSAAGRRAEGQANLALTLRGTAADPRVEGAVTVSGGSFSDELAGIRLNQIEARLAARGNVIAVERLTAATPNGGSLGVSGQVIIDPAAGFPANLRITGTNAQLVSSPVVTATVNLALEVTGPVLRGPLVAGRVAIVSMNVSIPERLGGASRPLPETRHVRPPRQTQARLAQERRNREAASRRGGMATPVRLDLAISAQNRIFVRGRGLNAELGGDLRLQGSVQDPVAIGAFSLRRGRFDLLGQRIDLVRGELAFTGDLSPSLDFLAQTQAGDTTARIAVTGTASQPEVTLSSTPDLPNDEILSRLLFQRASGGLSAVQALQLAQAVSQLSGGGSGPDVFDSLRRGLGVDSLDITTGTGGGIGVGVGRYITDNVRVGVRAGARPEDSGVTVDIDVTKRLRIQGGVGAGGDTSLGVGAEWEY